MGLAKGATLFDRLRVCGLIFNHHRPLTTHLIQLQLDFGTAEIAGSGGMIGIEAHREEVGNKFLAFWGKFLLIDAQGLQLPVPKVRKSLE